jgi:HD-GYP domain-containing protein (c-di-GMP phosphodiesterase class II)
MTTTATRPRPLPVVLYFSGDVAARKAIKGILNFTCAAWRSGTSHHKKGAVLLSSCERTLHEHWTRWRGDERLRVIALSDERFSDAGLDRAVYAYLPVHTPPPLVERMVENAFSDIRVSGMRQYSDQRLDEADWQIDELNRIGAALSAEHDTHKLLEMILTKSRQITRADAGSLYLVEDTDGERRLRFVLAQNDSVAIHFRESTMEINPQSIAGYVALTGGTVNLTDAYQLPRGVPYSINRNFDEASGYRTKSILAVPLRNQKDEMLGLVQLINCKRDPAVKLSTQAAVDAEVTAFTQQHQELATSLASQAAVALENNRLVEDIKRLFEGFLRASVIAIETRDPTTCGHSFRVANLTLGLAEACERAGLLHFTPEQMREVRYASLLHDFGKVGVREDVLVKAQKLYPLQPELVRQRFQLAACATETELLRDRLRFMLQHGPESYLREQDRFDAELARQLGELASFRETIEKANIPSLLPEGSFERLEQIAAHSYKDAEGQCQPLLTRDEVRLLSIRKGSLDDDERRQIEAHVEHTYHYLSQIPWTKDLRNVPQIARAHHEKLNGQGYPRQVAAAEIPLQARMIAICDVYDGITACDRPYKKAATPEQALDILAAAAANGEIDGELFRIFREARVYEAVPSNPQEMAVEPDFPREM